MLFWIWDCTYLGSMCVGVSVWLGWSGIRVAGWSTNGLFIPHEQTSCASACYTDTIPTQPHQISNTHRTKNNTTNVVIQQNSCKLLIMDILMSETCWAHKEWNKIASDIKLVFYSPTIKMMHGPINIRIWGRLPSKLTQNWCWQQRKRWSICYCRSPKIGKT